MHIQRDGPKALSLVILSCVTINILEPALVLAGAHTSPELGRILLRLVLLVVWYVLVLFVNFLLYFRVGRISTCDEHLAMEMTSQSFKRVYHEPATVGSTVCFAPESMYAMQITSYTDGK